VREDGDDDSRVVRFESPQVLNAEVRDDADVAMPPTVKG